MARLQLPQTNREAIRQDYRDKHDSGGAVLVCRKYDMQVQKDWQPVFDKAGNPVTYKRWYEAKDLTTCETEYVRRSHFPSERNHNDCYATINHFPVEYSPAIFDAMANGKMSYRSADNISYLTGFYIDFDNRKIHALAKNQQASELVEDALAYADQIVGILESYFQGDYGMPVISFTGGGYGFYWKIKTGFSGFLKIFGENYRTNLLLLTKILQRGAKDDYRKILQGDSGAISRIHNQRPDVSHLSYQQKDLLELP